MDQRGAGKSKPHAEIKVYQFCDPTHSLWCICYQENTTWDLVDDMEKLRKHLGIEKWVLFGGSWGSTLSLVYAIKHTEHVKALVVAAVVTGRMYAHTNFARASVSALLGKKLHGYIKKVGLRIFSPTTGKILFLPYQKYVAVDYFKF